MFAEKNRAKRFNQEAKAIQRKANRNGGELSGRDAARLTQAAGRFAKVSAQTMFDDTDTDNYGEYN